MVATTEKQPSLKGLYFTGFIFAAFRNKSLDNCRDTLPVVKAITSFDISKTNSKEGGKSPAARTSWAFTVNHLTLTVYSSILQVISMKFRHNLKIKND